MWHLLHLSLQVGTFGATERLRTITIDEMSLTASRDFDVSSGSIVGETALPDCSGPATQGLVIMIAGVITCWKQAIGYHLTNKSTDGLQLTRY